MPSTAPTRIDDDLFESAKHASAFTGRSASQQVAYWARVGREVEASSAIRIRQLDSRLASAPSYDDLEPEDQARVRAEWAEGIAARLRRIDFAEAFRALGVPWIGVDARGNLVRRVPRGYDPAGVAGETRSVLGIREAASDDVIATLARAEARLAIEQAGEEAVHREDEAVRKAPRRNQKKARVELRGSDPKPTRGQQPRGTQTAQKVPVVKKQGTAKKATAKQATAGTGATTQR